MNNRKKIYRMVASALLAALVVLLGMTPLGLIPLGFINVTVLCVPVIAGVLLLGARVGLILGFCFGTVSTFSMLGLSMTPPSGLAAALFSASPAGALLMCYVPRLLTPMTAYGVYHGLRRINCRETVALPIAAALGSMTNTILYLGLMLLFYVLNGLETAQILALITGTGLIAGGSEAVAAAVLVTPVVLALRKTPLAAALTSPVENGCGAGDGGSTGDGSVNVAQQIKRKDD